MVNEFNRFGSNLRDLLDGFLRQTAESRLSITGDVDTSTSQRVAWGRVVDRRGLPELFAEELAPKVHVRGQHPPAGIDHMRLKTVDVFRIPGRGEFTVPFEGYFEVTRGEPSTNDWATATVYVNFTDLRLFGEHPELGGIMVDLNPNVVSGGNTFPGRGSLGVVACRINVAARFHVESIETVLFNKTPIQLKNDDVQGIPTIGEGGQAYVGSLPLYRTSDPNGELFGYVEEVEYMVLNYATRDEVNRHKQARSFSQFQAMSGT